MDKASAGEKVLRLCVSRERAAELVGDQLEARPGTVRFWVGIVGLVLAFSWRTLLAILFSFPAGIVLSSSNFVLSAKYMRSHGNLWFTKAHSPLLSIFALSGPLWMLCSFSMMRFGANRLTKMILIAAILASSGGWLVTVRSGAAWFACVSAILLVYALGDADRRMALLVLVAASGAACAGGALDIHLYRLLFPQRPHLPHRFFFSITLLNIPVLQSLVLLFLSKRLLEPRHKLKQA